MRVRAGLFYDAYAAWMAANKPGRPTLSAARFGMQASTQYHKEKTRFGNVYVGLMLKPLVRKG